MYTIQDLAAMPAGELWRNMLWTNVLRWLIAIGLIGQRRHGSLVMMSRARR
jgi:hypothetical protein